MPEIPAPLPADHRPERTFVTIDDPRWTQCHASTVARAHGRTVVAWFAGTHEGTEDNRIRIAVADDAAGGPAAARPGAGWEGPATTLDTGRRAAHWNPVLAPGPDGALWLFCKVGARISEWVTLVTRSHDGGLSWEPARELVPGDRSGGRGPVRNQPLATPDGRWLAPGSTERWGRPPRWQPFVDVSEDHGATWHRATIPTDHATLTGAGHIQPALWWGRGGPVALLRSTEGRAHRATSADGGRGWTPARPTGLPNNNSGLAALALPSGRVVCVHNPGAEPWGSRCPLVLSCSDDDGLTWRQVTVVDDGATPVDPAVPRSLPATGVPGFAPADTGVRTSGAAEYSYPFAVLADDHLLITYTWQRRGIVLARLPIADLEDTR
ncbi:neuraminidase (sialidase) [Streptomyces sp. 8K308]|uniref:exo-alpha-sialidase n=1 Tax=Streptomyces sp. 8K308 TaxID=2530388 RepID=UPI0010452D6F|nr:sialidase family protein [Streptomyces sp. 8K308]TDC24777.1 neuraminidase (sialidase) [Streptomyces sp. 8K308]